LSEGQSEVLLAEEQAVIHRGVGLKKEIEGAFGFGGETEGTLILTNRRLIYAHKAAEKEVDLPVGLFSYKSLFIDDIEGLDSISNDSEGLEIPLSQIVRVEGHGGRDAIAPKLEVQYAIQSGETRSTEFVEQITGASRKKNLNDWAEIIRKLKASQVKLTELPGAPSEGTLEGRIYRALGDMQEKGALAIEEEVEERYNVDLDPDDVVAACDKLVGMGLIRKADTDEGDPFYTRISQLGENDVDG
jgi:hypothetical protein